MAVNLALAIVGGVLVFALPGYAVAKSVFPEWRVRGAGALLTAVELATLSFVLSVTLTVLVGFVLLNAAPSGFQATWSNPALELSLAGISLVGLAVAYLRGAFARNPPSAPHPEEDTGATGGWEAMRRMDDLARQERGLRRSLTRIPPGSDEDRRIRDQLEKVQTEASAVRAAREAELAG
ncbi:MAG: DUF1616 domain-containing protein [Thermoplasmata archaeon]|nr:DUF1616 domain-containing protein [Thermoplasmata archaeon]